MPSEKSQRTLNMLRRHRDLVQAVNTAVLDKITLPDETVARLKVFGTKAQLVRNGKVPTMLILPRRVATTDAVLLHMHGGAYVSGDLLQARMVISPIVSESKIPAVTFSYRLAPEHPYPAQLQDALKTYRLLLKNGIKPHKIAFVGESAGGNLAIALALLLRSLGEPMPGALCLLSPWGDLLQTGESYRVLRDVDATLDAPSLLESAIEFAGGRKEKLQDPMLSPIYANYHGFPPTQIHVGDSELLLSDSETIHAAMRRDGVSASLFRWVGMCHVFQVFGFDESRASIRSMADFLAQQLTGKRRSAAKDDTEPAKLP